MDNSISFLVGLKNNLEYSQKFYEITRINFPEQEIVFVSFGSTDGTHEWLDSLNDPYLKYYYSKDSKSLSDTYNKAIEIATGKYVSFLHNDMVPGKYFVKNLQKYLSEEKVICYFAVEPPLFAGDRRSWKTVRDFGSDFWDFNYDGFFEYEKNNVDQYNELVQISDTTFFLTASKAKLMEIKGLDPLFYPMFCEDDDLILRLKLAGLQLFLSKGSVVYHFVSKTSRFSEEFSKKTKGIEENSLRNFTRKWHFFSNNTVKKSYNIGFVLKNATSEAVNATEPFATDLYVDKKDVVGEYLQKESSASKIDIRKKFKSYTAVKTNDVIITIDAKKWRSGSYKIINNIPEIIHKLSAQKTISKMLFGYDKKYRKLGITIDIVKKQSFENQNINKSYNEFF
jgi:GT2 family glycosyltransferase